MSLEKSLTNISELIGNPKGFARIFIVKKKSINEDDKNNLQIIGTAYTPNFKFFYDLLVYPPLEDRVPEMKSEQLPLTQQIDLIKPHITIGRIVYSGADNMVIEPEIDPDVKGIQKQEIGAVEESITIDMQMERYSAETRATLKALRSIHRSRQLMYGDYQYGTVGFLCDIDHFNVVPTKTVGLTLRTPTVNWTPGSTVINVSLTLVLGIDKLVEPSVED